MASIRDEEAPVWYTSRRFQKVAIVVLAAFALGEGVVGILLKENDFEWHRNLGLAFLEGDPYKNQGVHYLPARTMLNALTAWMPCRVDRAVVFVTALAALAWTILAWHRLANQSRPMPDAVAFAAIVFTLAVTGAYLQRDLDDCGLQILLLFFLTAAAVALQAGRALRCGFWLGLAVVYKLTPILFLPYLCYKRQWRAAGWMVVFAIAWSLAPALSLGWDVNLKAHARCYACIRTCFSTVDPVETTIEPPNHRNQSLNLAIARFAQTYPSGHSLYLESPLFAQFGDLEPAAAKRVVQGVEILLALVLAWRFRKSSRAPESEGDAQRELAAVILLTAILSPFCWVQHLVLVLPAVFLVVRAALESGGLSPWQRRLGGLAALIMMVAAQRDILGHGLFMVGMSYKLHTFAALLALALVLTLSRRVSSGGIPQPHFSKWIAKTRPLSVTS